MYLFWFIILYIYFVLSYDIFILKVWAEGGRGLFSLPMSPEEVTQEELIDNFPVKQNNTMTCSRFVYLRSFLFYICKYTIFGFIIRNKRILNI